ncbi:hypothetical protein [Flammeovirga aprica]|uniref:Uncharacterized protein n=1 Tax=Flammeovirga aprica JL-4 TaxID=694437 RepID=A0A7X9RUL8_9BACT|nr:hypothetical protein [Flammeovirga aprica]NME69021.1 hypothetical protein [Flammeovirga aprica JL-4]
MGEAADSRGDILATVIDRIGDYHTFDSIDPSTESSIYSDINAFDEEGAIDDIDKRIANGDFVVKGGVLYEK